MRFEKQDDSVLEKIRKVLKRADHVRQMLAGPEDQLPEAVEMPNGDDAIESTATAVPEYTSSRVVNEDFPPYD